MRIFFYLQYKKKQNIYSIIQLIISLTHPNYTNSTNCRRQALTVSNLALGHEIYYIAHNIILPPSPPQWAMIPKLGVSQFFVISQKEKEKIQRIPKKKKHR